MTAWPVELLSPGRPRLVNQGRVAFPSSGNFCTFTREKNQKSSILRIDVRFPQRFPPVTGLFCRSFTSITSPEYILGTGMKKDPAVLSYYPP